MSEIGDAEDVTRSAKIWTASEADDRKGRPKADQAPAWTGWRVVGQVVEDEAAVAAERKKEAGFIHRPGVVWVGQSVFLLTPERSREFQDYLNGKGVSYGRLKVRIE